MVFECMMDRNMRLSQAARKLNTNHNEILDFLSKNGHIIENNPNSKLTEDQISLLVGKFGPIIDQPKSADTVNETIKEIKGTVKEQVYSINIDNLITAEAVVKFCIKHKIKIEQYFFLWFLLKKDWVKPFSESLSKQYLDVAKFTFKDLDDLEKRGFVTNLNVVANSLPELYILNDNIRMEILSKLFKSEDPMDLSREINKSKDDFWNEVGIDPDIY
jgi:hypothetical protein